MNDGQYRVVYSTRVEGDGPCEPSLLEFFTWQIYPNVRNADMDLALKTALADTDMILDSNVTTMQMSPVCV